MFQARYAEVVVHMHNYAKNFHIVIVGRHDDCITKAGSASGKGMK